jgi:hypothetical protein
MRKGVVHSGPLRGATLHELWTSGEEIFGSDYKTHTYARFPMLIAARCARTTLSSGPSTRHEPGSGAGNGDVVACRRPAGPKHLRWT